MSARGLVRLGLGAVARQVPSFRGKRRAASAVDRVLVGEPGVFTHRSGVRFRLSGERDLIERNLLYLGDYAPEVIALLERCFSLGGGTYWDVGANIGSVALPLLGVLGEVQGFLFEPSPGVLARLVQNVQLNPSVAVRAQICGVALSDVTGLAQFYVSAEPGNSGVAGLGTSHNRVQTPILVQATRADTLIEGGTAAPDVMKLDVEGFEIEAFRGFGSVLRTRESMAIIFEHSPYRLSERGRPPEEVLEYLTAQGFEVFCQDGGRVGAPAQRRDLERDTDFIALKGRYRELAPR